MIGDNTSPEMEKAAAEIVDAIFKVHRKLLPGLLESVYEHCLVHELRSRGLDAERQVEMPVTYEGVKIDVGFRIDILVNGSIIIEIKSVEQMHPVFEAQVITYLRLSGKRLGFLVNFNVQLIKNGIKRVIL